MRFVSWPDVGEEFYVLHPDPITAANVGPALGSGALFARKFDYKVTPACRFSLCTARRFGRRVLKA